MKAIKLLYSNLTKLEIMKTIEQKSQELISIGFFVGGLTDEGIVYYYNKLIATI